MRVNTFTCLITFFLVCLFFLLFHKSPLLAIGLIIVLVGFRFAKTTKNPFSRVIHELHTLNHNLATLATISDSMEKIVTQIQADAEKDAEKASPTEPRFHSETFPQESSEIEI